METYASRANQRCCIKSSYYLPAQRTTTGKNPLTLSWKKYGFTHINIAAFNPHYLTKVEVCRERHAVKTLLGTTSIYSAASTLPHNGWHQAHCQPVSPSLVILPSQSSPFPFWSPAAESPCFPLEFLQKGKKERATACKEIYISMTPPTNHYLVKIEAHQNCPVRMKEHFRWNDTSSVLVEQCPLCVVPWTISQHLFSALMTPMLFLCVIQDILYMQMAVMTYWKWLHTMSWWMHTQEVELLWHCWAPSAIKRRKVKPALA